jgi:hypothetical protein
MTQERFRATEGDTGVNQLQIRRFLQWDDEKALENVKSILVDAAVEAGALIDAVCCRCGNWIDWEHYRPHPVISAGRDEDPGSIIRLALPGSDFGLRAGGYIEMRVLPKERVIEADGGYYDPHREPRKVIDESLRWHELSRQRLGQVLVVMFDRIIREYMVKERSDGSPDGRSRGPDWGPDSERLCLA